jgi:hypothetical protein
MPHPSYLAVTVEVIDGVPDDVEREEAKNDERNRKPKVDELLHNKENDCCDAKNNRRKCCKERPRFFCSSLSFPSSAM